MEWAGDASVDDVTAQTQLPNSEMLRSMLRPVATVHDVAVHVNGKFRQLLTVEKCDDVEALVEMALKEQSVQNAIGDKQATRNNVSKVIFKELQDKFLLNLIVAKNK